MEVEREVGAFLVAANPLKSYILIGIAGLSGPVSRIISTRHI
jgi:hypothetical protein